MKYILTIILLLLLLIYILNINISYINTIENNKKIISQNIISINLKNILLKNELIISDYTKNYIEQTNTNNIIYVQIDTSQFLSTNHVYEEYNKVDILENKLNEVIYYLNSILQQY